MWIDRIILFLMGTAVLILQDFSYMSIIIITSAITASCLCGYYDKKIVLLVVSLVWLGLTLVFHDFIWMWGLITFEITRQKAYPLYIILVMAHLVLGLYYSVFSLSLLVICLIILVTSVALALKDNKILASEEEIIKIRDSSTEVELLLNQRNEKLERDQSSEIEIATLKERGRIAMEIHDNVGHILSRAILQTGAMITTSKGEEDKKNLGELSDTLKSAMDSIRESVHGLKDDSFDLKKNIQDCIDDFPNYNFSFHYDIDNNAPKNVKYCFAVIIKEAFSNASKHSNADKIKIDLQEHPAFYKLMFSDNGTTKINMNSTKGIGLENMRERAEALNGTFKINTDKGFAIHVVLPKINVGGSSPS